MKTFSQKAVVIIVAVFLLVSCGEGNDNQGPDTQLVGTWIGTISDGTDNWGLNIVIDEWLNAKINGSQSVHATATMNMNTREGHIEYHTHDLDGYIWAHGYYYFVMSEDESRLNFNKQQVLHPQIYEIYLSGYLTKVA
jgi:hypothetical protein